MCVCVSFYIVDKILDWAPPLGWEFYYNYNFKKKKIYVYMCI